MGVAALKQQSSQLSRVQVARGGFTLAESLFAIGIVSFTLLAIVAMVPVALDSLKNSERRAAEQRIFHAILSEHEAMTWPQLTSIVGNTQTRYYDEFGQEMLSQTSGTGVDAWYQAQVLVQEAEPLIGPVQTLLPSGTSRFLRGLTVKITANPKNNLAFVDKNQFSSDHRVFSGTLMNTQADP
jgi:uncharacterized protein (TIGR02598 family)